MKILRSKTYNDMLKEMRKQNDRIEELQGKIDLLQDKLKDPNSCIENDGSDFCKICKNSYTSNVGTEIFPMYRSKCALNVTCEKFDMKEN